MSKHASTHWVCQPRLKEKSRLVSNDFGFICAGVNIIRD